MTLHEKNNAKLTPFSAFSALNAEIAGRIGQRDGDDYFFGRAAVNEENWEVVA